MEPVICADCGIEAIVRDPAILASCGWDLECEYGQRCPSCVNNVNPSHTEGLDALVEVVGLTKKENT